MLWDWENCGNVINLTKLLYDLGKIWPDYATRLDSDQAVARGCASAFSGGFALEGECRLTRYGNFTGTYTESASFLKLRELSLAWVVPRSVVDHLWAGAQNVRLTASGRNLFVSTPYSGMDPEVSNFGNQPVQRNIDVAPYPRSRSFWLTLSA